ncbi:MAG: phosphatase PAP2 family protein [Aquaticitalea sp.]
MKPHNFFYGVLLLLIFFLSNTSVAQNVTNHEPQYEKTIQDIGDFVHVGMPIAVGVTTLIIGDKKGTWQFAKGFGVNLAATFVLKYTINKPRPNGATDGHAFPSGHTSVAFQSASFLQRRYGWKYGIPAYALAGFVAYSRIDGANDRHDGWDILAGAIIGVGSTYLFTTPYEQEHLQLSFSSKDQNYLLGLNYKF